MYLLDTNVVSELRRPRPNPAVLAWMSEASSEALFLSAVTIGEIHVRDINAFDVPVLDPFSVP